MLRPDRHPNYGRRRAEFGGLGRRLGSSSVFTNGIFQPQNRFMRPQVDHRRMGSMRYDRIQGRWIADDSSPIHVSAGRRLSGGDTEMEQPSRNPNYSGLPHPPLVSGRSRPASSTASYRQQEMRGSQAGEARLLQQQRSMPSARITPAASAGGKRHIPIDLTGDDDDESESNAKRIKTQDLPSKAHRTLPIKQDSSLKAVIPSYDSDEERFMRDLHEEYGTDISETIERDKSRSASPTPLSPPPVATPEKSVETRQPNPVGNHVKVFNDWREKPSVLVSREVPVAHQADGTGPHRADFKRSRYGRRDSSAAPAVTQGMRDRVNPACPFDEEDNSSGDDLAAESEVVTGSQGPANHRGAAEGEPTAQPDAAVGAQMDTEADESLFVPDSGYNTTDAVTIENDSSRSSQSENSATSVGAISGTAMSKGTDESKRVRPVNSFKGSNQGLCDEDEIEEAFANFSEARKQQGQRQGTAAETTTQVKRSTPSKNAVASFRSDHESLSIDHSKFKKGEFSSSFVGRSTGMGIEFSKPNVTQDQSHSDNAPGPRSLRDFCASKSQGHRSESSDDSPDQDENDAFDYRPKAVRKEPIRYKPVLGLRPDGRLAVSVDEFILLNAHQGWHADKIRYHLKHKHGIEHTASWYRDRYDELKGTTRGIPIKAHEARGEKSKSKVKAKGNQEGRKTLSRAQSMPPPRAWQTVIDLDIDLDDDGDGMQGGDEAATTDAAPARKISLKSQKTRRDSAIRPFQVHGCTVHHEPEIPWGDRPTVGGKTIPGYATIDDSSEDEDEREDESEDHKDHAKSNGQSYYLYHVYFRKTPRQREYSTEAGARNGRGRHIIDENEQSEADSDSGSKDERNALGYRKAFVGFKSKAIDDVKAEVGSTAQSQYGDGAEETGQHGQGAQDSDHTESETAVHEECGIDVDVKTEELADVFDDVQMANNAAMKAVTQYVEAHDGSMQWTRDEGMATFVCTSSTHTVRAWVDRTVRFIPASERAPVETNFFRRTVYVVREVVEAFRQPTVGADQTDESEWETIRETDFGGIYATLELANHIAADRYFELCIKPRFARATGNLDTNSFYMQAERERLNGMRKMMDDNKVCFDQGREVGDGSKYLRVVVEERQFQGPRN